MGKGRPKKNANEKKTEIVGMAVSVVNKQKILAAAQKAELSVSDFLFNAIKHLI